MLLTRGRGGPTSTKTRGTLRSFRSSSSTSSIPKVRMATPSTRRSIIRRTALSIRGEQDLVAVLDCDGFENLNNFRKEGVSNFRNDETKNPAAAGNQGPRLSIRIISKFFDYAPNALGQG